MQLTQHLINRIAAEGPLSVEAFMAEALYHPEWGYYTTQIPIGRDGDYITAPEMTQVFGELIGLWAYVQWEQQDQPSDLFLIELGPGRGTLMADILRVAKHYPDFHKSLRIYLVEQSTCLHELQKQTLANQTINWVSDLSAVPLGPTVLIANEFFDALPLQQFIFKNGRWWERAITNYQDKFDFCEIETSLQPLYPPNEDAIYEQCPEAVVITQEIAKRLHLFPGAALIIDYGYEGPASGDTLQALSHHQYHNPLSNVGQVDLTHHVDFRALKTIFCQYNLKVESLQSMGAFLKELGLIERTEQLCREATPSQRQQLLAAAVRLTNPQYMGELFKVLNVASRK